MNKLRITTFDEVEVKGEVSLIIKEDRLVQATTEFATGPKDKHTGPIRIDYIMDSKDEVESLIQYLSQLALDLPLSDKAKKTYERKSQSNQILAADSIDTLITQATQKGKDQEALIDYLRTLNFAFLTYDHLKDITEKNGIPFNIKNPKHANYQYMVRILKLAKDPKNDKIDHQVFFGIKLIGDRYPRVLLYKEGEWDKNLEIHWKDGQEIQFKVKEKFYKFPEPMTYEERSRWRAEDRKMHDNPEVQPSAFFTRWAPYVKKLRQLRNKK